MYSYFIFALVVIFIYLFFWKPSGVSEKEKGIDKAENEARIYRENMVEMMMDQDQDYLCFFCGSTDFSDQSNFYNHIKVCKGD